MTKNCQICEKSFSPKCTRSKVCYDKECKRVYRNWQARGYRIKYGLVVGEVTRNCNFCGKEYSRRFDTKYCTKECAKKEEVKRKRESYVKGPLVKDNCVVCGAEFTTNKPNSRKRKKTCSKECAWNKGRAKQSGTSYQRQVFTKQCAECGKDFEVFTYAKANGEPSEGGKPKKYCSNNCCVKMCLGKEKNKMTRRRSKMKTVRDLSDQYVIDQIQKSERRSSRDITSAKKVTQLQINLKRIELLAHRGEQLDKNLSDREKVKQFEETLNRTLRSNTAILPH